MTNRDNMLSKVIGKLVFLCLLISGLLTACAPAGTTDRSVNWIPLVLAILLVLVLVFAGILLIKTGKFQEWGSSAINAGKWKIQKGKLQGQKEDIEGEVEGLIAKLGEKAWEAKVSHPSYQEHFEALEALEGQKQTLAEEIVTLETKLTQARESRANLVDDYSKQLKDLRSLQKDVEKKTDKSHSQQSKLTKEFEKINKEHQKALSEIEDDQHKLAEVQASDAPDKESQVASLSKSIQSLQETVAKTSEQLEEIEAEHSKLGIAQQPVTDKITRFKDQISTVEADQKEALIPLDQRITELEAEIQLKKAHIEDLQQKITPIMQTLGPLVNSARPESEDLTTAYYKIDQAKSRLAEVTKEHHLVVARLEACDKEMVRHFYLMIAGFLVLVVLIVVLFVLAIG